MATGAASDVRMNYVVGSGPAGTMCAAALLEAGEPVTLLDVGRRLEPERFDIVRALQVREPEDWEPEEVAAIRDIQRHGSSAVDLKRTYGSNFPYALDRLSEIEQVGTKCTISFARGGLSNVWGGGVLPFTPDELAEWPIGLEDLAPFYKSVAQLIPVTGEIDDLATTRPFYGEARPALRLSEQAEFVHRRLQTNREYLSAHGYTGGVARLAVHSTADHFEQGCRYCSLCLSGCPYGLIYRCDETLQLLRARNLFKYQSGFKVRRIEEPDADGIVIVGEDDTGAVRRLRGGRVFLACGVLSTVQIVLDSLDIPGADLRLPYPPYFLLPMMSFHNTDRPDQERRHTLAQLFLEVHKPAESSHAMHLSYYSFDQLMKSRLSQILGPLRIMSRPVEAVVLGRLAAVQGFLHGNEGGEISVSYRKSFGHEFGHLRLIGNVHHGASRIIRRLVVDLARRSGRTGLFPIFPMLTQGKPGDGNHIGGVFPMRDRPQRFETDRLGRLQSFRRLHVVDGSVMTTVPAAPPTYTIMANACRIGMETARSSGDFRR